MTDAERDYEDMRRFQEWYIVADQKCEHLKKLCSRSVNALSGCTWQERDALIIELRKAAE